MEVPELLGAKDVMDLSWKQPARCVHVHRVRPLHERMPRQPDRQIAEPTQDHDGHPRPRDGSGYAIDLKGKWEDDGAALLGSYITEEELWACTTCNACTQACPVNIDPVGIIATCGATW